MYNDGDQIRQKSLPAKGPLVDPRSPFRRDYARLIHAPCFRRLQGKTQLFPGEESDFFRNRLTHSLEVSQVATGIALRLNQELETRGIEKIDLDLVATAALAHDLGHPPFGHNGERALDDFMKEMGGFEGNAQTLRILSKIEKRDLADDYIEPIQNGRDGRLGLNLTYRTYAAVLKYDQLIKPFRRKQERLEKGYYKSEETLVQEIKKHVTGAVKGASLKTIECQIMDIADDIAYSTYDLEDAMKGGFLSLLNLHNCLYDAGQHLLTKIVEKVKKACKEDYGDSVTANDVKEGLKELTKELFNESHMTDLKDDYRQLIASVSRLNTKFCSNGYVRASLSSMLVDRFVHAVQLEINTDRPALSKACLGKEERIQVEVLKQMAYTSVIESPSLKISEARGYEIVSGLFERLSRPDGLTLLPDDARELYEGLHEKSEKMRVICDFIAGMTDRYAVELYSRLHSVNPQSIFRPV